MPWGAVAGAVIGGIATTQASDKAAGASNSATNASIGEQRAAREQYRYDIQPFMQSGTNALNTVNALNSGNMDAFHESPDYQWTLDQGLAGLDRSAAARGNLNAGGHDVDLMRYAQGLASQQYNSFYDKQYNLAAMGQNAIAGQGSAAQNTASNIGNLLMGNAQAQGNAAMNTGNAWANAANTLGGAWAQYRTQSYNPNSYANNPNYLSPITRQQFTPEGGYGG